jgi:hypothetical protein
LLSGAGLWRILDQTPQIAHAKAPQPANGLRYVRVSGTPAQGYVKPELAERGRLRNGQDIVVVPLLSAGSGGVFFALVYTRLMSKAHFVDYISSRSGHLETSIRDGELEAVMPVYESTDAQCCPSRHRTQVYTLRGSHLERIRSTVHR